MTRRVMLVLGTRPEAIKLAPVVLALRRATDFEPIVVATAQHRSMLDQVLQLFQIVPQYDLHIMRERQGLVSVAARALEPLAALVAKEHPDMVMVQGDTTTTLVAALASFYNHVPVAHVEAGLRTGDPYLPYPEEMNRRLTSHLANLHFAPTATARDNLLAEGIDRRDILVTGNTAIDALLWAVERRADYEEQSLADLDQHSRPVLLVTAHRRESWGPALAEVGDAVADVARARPDSSGGTPCPPQPHCQGDFAGAFARFGQCPGCRADGLRVLRSPDGPVNPRLDGQWRHTGGSAKSW